MEEKKIIVRGAKEHNLKNISLEIPRDRLVVITGLSGSGKSSLAFDTLYAEGQRRYVESLSSYARQFLDQMEKPDVESIEGLPPTISIEQRVGSGNPRSTVATTTEIYDYLRLLFARAGTPYCWKCDREIRRQTAPQIVDQLIAAGEGKKAQILSPVIRGKKGEHRDVLRRLQAEGFVRARVDGKVHDLSEVPSLHKQKKHTIEAVVDRITLSGKKTSRIQESVETALKFGGGLCLAQIDGEKKERVFSELYACPVCNISYEEISPRMFSFNSPYGACSTCDGLGTRQEFDEELVVPDRSKSIEEGGIQAWKRLGRRMTIYYNGLLREICAERNIDVDAPFEELPKRTQEGLLYGFSSRPEFEGVIPNLERRFAQTESPFVKHRLLRFMSDLPCSACKGARLRRESLAVKAGGKNILDVTRMNIDRALAFFRDLKLGKEKDQIARPIRKEIVSRLSFMVNVGLEYLTLDRTTGSLSGGEAQRIRLATQVGTGLVGVCYVLDEPTIGLHQRDNDRLLATLRRLQGMGNSVLIVEHDEDTIRSADHVIDLGPGAGAHGGEVTAQGTIEEICQAPRSITGKYLSGEFSIPVPEKRRAPSKKQSVKVKGAAENNLKRINVTFPLGLFTCVTGVSGSGKSTLVSDILYRGTMRQLHGSREKPGKHKEIRGLDEIDKVIEIDQSPIGRTPRSNPATYAGAFDLIRNLFSQTVEAKIRGYRPGRFSFNVKGGRCEACEGQGTKRIEMHFLPDMYVTCEECRGSRYNRETLEVKYKGLSIAEVLNLSVEEACDFFKNIPRLKRILQTLHDVGLDYVRLGQSSTTLSGGEAQRIKLANELGKQATGRTLYIMDEPTTGLHFADIKNLLGVINRLTEAGNTFIVIEHNLDVIKTADWIIDLGPEGGEAGGRIVATGTPEEVARNSKSYTGQYLRRMFHPAEYQAVPAPVRKVAEG